MTEFISNNQIWFILIGVLCVMALIGYVAEKNNLGKKKERAPRKVVPEPEIIEEVQNEPVVENSIQTFEAEDSKLNDEIVNEDITIQKDVTLNSDEDLIVPISEVQNEQNIEAVASELGIDPAILTPLEGAIVSDEFGVDNVPMLHIDEAKEGTETESNDVWKF